MTLKTEGFGIGMELTMKERQALACVTGPRCRKAKKAEKSRILKEALIAPYMANSRLNQQPRGRAPRYAVMTAAERGP
jgi:hypothetical protein